MYWISVEVEGNGQVPPKLTPTAASSGGVDGCLYDALLVCSFGKERCKLMKVE